MTTVQTTQTHANIAVLNRTKDKAAVASLAVLEQMYGYFSFQPMPLEQTEQRQAA